MMPESIMPNRTGTVNETPRRHEVAESIAVPGRQNRDNKAAS